MKKVLCAVLCVMIAFSFSIVGFALESNSIQPKWTQLYLVDANLLVDDITLNAITRAQAKSRDVTISIDMDLQMYDDGWTTIKSWSDERDATLELNRKYAVEEGYQYRVRSVISVYDNGKFIESTTKTSDTVRV